MARLTKAQQAAKQQQEKDQQFLKQCYELLNDPNSTNEQRAFALQCIERTPAVVVVPDKPIRRGKNKTQHAGKTGLMAIPGAPEGAKQDPAIPVVDEAYKHFNHAVWRENTKSGLWGQYVKVHEDASINIWLPAGHEEISNYL